MDMAFESPQFHEEVPMVKRRMRPARGFSKINVSGVPNQSGVYELIDQKGDVTYVGMAGPGRLQDRLKEHLTARDVPGIRRFRFLPTTRTKDAHFEEDRRIVWKKPRHNVPVTGA